MHVSSSRYPLVILYSDMRPTQHWFIPEQVFPMQDDPCCCTWSGFSFQYEDSLGCHRSVSGRLAPGIAPNRKSKTLSISRSLMRANLHSGWGLTARRLRASRLRG